MANALTGFAEVSVVMGVYNGAGALRQTIDSVLLQEGVNIEFIVVDDGSTDATAEILAEYAVRDNRVRVLSQENKGLTEALVAGCALARGVYIARQDCGDMSLPGRLAGQRDVLDTQPAAVMVSCATRYVGPCDESLYTIVKSNEELQEGLRQLSIKQVRGPSHHGSTMFRRSSYEQVGGYRAIFRVAQDIDLWLRFSEIGQCIAIPEALYQAKLVPGSISATRRGEQLRTAKCILACAIARRAGGSESEIVSSWRAADETSAEGGRKRTRAGKHARFYYFIASVLRLTQPKRSRHYYLKSIRSWALYAPAWVGLIRLTFR